ncbi:MAG: penicillin-binding protein 2 [Proteobacteria bacterium]|nr:penicillin-binding protein 2 [Pseudomonadota bacterium]
MSGRNLKDTHGEASRFGVRALIGFALIVLALAVLGGRFWYLQVMRHDEFTTRSQANRVHLRHLPPPRGLIYDRNGVLLADNVPAFRLDVVPEQIKGMDAMLARLSTVVPLSGDDIARFRQSLRQHRPFEAVPLKFHLDEADIDRFAVNAWKFPGVDIAPYLTRNYPLGPDFAHVIGYVARIDEKDLAHLDADRYAGTTHIGKTGIEKYYENRLHGTPGYELVEVNADQRPQRVLERVAPKPGQNLYLGIDTRIQKAAIAAFAGRPGAAVAIDPRNGEVLAMVTVPSFDPNLFVNGIGQADYSDLLHDPDKPLLNRALRGGYPPGSTIKPFMGLAGLELGLRRPTDTVFSSGTFYIPGQSRGYRDDQRYGAGTVNLMQAITQSVNTYFYSLALAMGIDRMDAYLSKFGFGAETGVDLPSESGGVLPSPGWKRATFNQPWYAGETVIAGIGQGYWVVTPIQLAHAVAMLADGGLPHTPHLLRATRDGRDGAIVARPDPPEAPSAIRNPADFDAVRQGMIGVVYDPRGTTYNVGIRTGFPYVIAGKTGTAERFSRKGDEYITTKDKAILAARHRAWFICFTPAEAPRIAVAVVLEAGAWGGTDAAPIARKILDAWLATQPAPPAPSTLTAGAAAEQAKAGAAQ